MKIVKNPNATELVKRTEVENSPFVIITTEHNEKTVNFVTFGKYRISGDFDTVENAINYINNMTWDKVITVSSLLYDMMKLNKD